MSRFAESKYPEARSDCSDDSFELLSSASASPRTDPAVVAPRSPSVSFTHLSRESSRSSNASSSFELVSASSPAAVPALHPEAWIAVVSQPSSLPAASSSAVAPSSPAAASVDASTLAAWLADLPDADTLRRELDEEDDRVFETYFLQVESDSEFRAGLRAMNRADAALRIKRRLRTSVRPELGATTVPMPHTRRMRRANRAAAQLIEDETEAPMSVATHRPLPKLLQRRARRAESLSPSESTSVRLRRGDDRSRSRSLEELRTDLLEKRIFRPVDWRSTRWDDAGCETPPFQEWAEEEEQKRRAQQLELEQIAFDKIVDAHWAAVRVAQAPFCIPTSPLQRPKHRWSLPRHPFRCGYEQWLADEQDTQEPDDELLRTLDQEDCMTATFNHKHVAAANGCKKTRKEQKLRAELKRIQTKEARSKPKPACPTLQARTSTRAAVVPAAVATGNSRARRAVARQAAAPRIGSRFVSPAIAGPAVLALRTTMSQRSRTVPKHHVTIAQISAQLHQAAASPTVAAQLLSASLSAAARVAPSKPYTAPYVNENWRARRMMSGYEHRFAHFNRCPYSLQPALDLPTFQQAFYTLYRGVIEASLNSALHGTRITAVRLATIPGFAVKWAEGWGGGSFERRFFLALLRRVQCGSNQPGVTPAELSLRFVPVQGCRYSRKRDSRVTRDSDGDDGFHTHDARACKLECQMGLSGYPWAISGKTECYAPNNLTAMHQRHDAAEVQRVTVAPLAHPSSLSFSYPRYRSKLSTPEPKPVLTPLTTRSVMVCATFDSGQNCADRSSLHDDSRATRDFVTNSASILPCVEVDYELVSTPERPSVKAMQRAIKRADAVEPSSHFGIHRARRAVSRASTLSLTTARNCAQFGWSTGGERRAEAALQQREDALADWNAEGAAFWRDQLETIWREMRRRDRREEVEAAAAGGEATVAAVAPGSNESDSNSEMERPPRVLFRHDGAAIANLTRRSRQISLS